MACPARKNTIVVCLENDDPKARAVDCHNFVRDVLKLSPTEVLAIQLDVAGGRKFYVKVTKPELCDQVVANQGGKYRFKFPDGNLGSVTAMHAVGLGTRTVRVFDLPPELDNDVIGAALAPYGTVARVVEEKWAGDYYYQCSSAVRRVQIALTKHVPSYVRIAGVKVLTSYDGQPRTCAVCDATDHARNQCPNKNRKKGWGNMPPLPQPRTDGATQQQRVPVMVKLTPTGAPRSQSPESRSQATPANVTTPSTAPKVATGAGPASAAAAAAPKADDGPKKVKADQKLVESQKSDNGKVTGTVGKGVAGTSAAAGGSEQKELSIEPNGVPNRHGALSDRDAPRTSKDWYQQTVEGEDLDTILTLSTQKPGKKLPLSSSKKRQICRSPSPTRAKSPKGSHADHEHSDSDGQMSTDSTLLDGETASVHGEDDGFALFD